MVLGMSAKPPTISRRATVMLLACLRSALNFSRLAGAASVLVKTVYSTDSRNTAPPT